MLNKKYDVGILFDLTQKKVKTSSYVHLERQIKTCKSQMNYFQSDLFNWCK